MKNRRFVLFVLAFLAFLGCEDATTVNPTKMTIQIDLLEHLEESQKLMPYEIPGDSGSDTLSAPPDSIDFSDEVIDVNEVESVEILVTIEFHNETGTAKVTFAAYLAALDEDPLDTPPIISETIALEDSMDTSNEIEIVGDARLLELFNEGAMQYLTQVLFEIEEGSDDVRGEAKLVQFDVTIETTL